MAQSACDGDEEVDTWLRVLIMGMERWMHGQECLPWGWTDGCMAQSAHDGDGEVDAWLRVLTTLQRILDWFPTPMSNSSQPLATPPPGNSMTSSGPCTHGTFTLTHIHMDINTLTDSYRHTRL